MPKQIISLFLLILTISAPGIDALAQDIIIGDIVFDRKEWGSRMVFIPVENLQDDTVRLNIVVHTIYPQHYLSGVDRLEVDTMIAVEPNGIDDIAIPFKMHGSFGRIITRVMVDWQFDNYIPHGNLPDSTFQIFNNYFTAKGDASIYQGKKHGIGPVYSVMDHFLLNYEYPRLVLFLLLRGESLDKINAMFEADMEYTREVVRDLRGAGFFPFTKDSLSPGLMAVAEEEGYAVKEPLKEAAGAFSVWYENTGKAGIDKILADVGVDDFTGSLPSIRMPLLHSLLMEKWADPSRGFDIVHFEDIAKDIRNDNQPSWIVQGGEFFLPKLCAGLFRQGEELYMGTFAPDASLPFDKAPIYDMRGEVDKEKGSIVAVEAEQLRRALAAAKTSGLTDGLEAELKNIIVKAEAHIGNFKAYQKPYLADYIIRSILGGYFAEHRPAQGIDCIKVRY